MNETLEAPPALTFCDAASAKVAELIRESDTPGLMLRVYVTGGGCSGFQYGFSFESSASPDDARVDRNGVTLLVDQASLQYLAGAEIDFEDGLEGARFIIRNPNATSTCGCGTSFSVDDPQSKEGGCNVSSCH